MRRIDSAAASPDALALLEQHAVYLSETDEAELISRAAETEDVGELALRTCRCGTRIDGFDAYWEHLRAAFERSV